MRAILLAAGEGNRLRPLTMHKAKPMIRAANKPIAQHVIEALVANGIRDIVLVVNYQRARIQSHFGDGQRFNARITYAFQDVLTGTAGALATVPRPDAPFLVLGADNVIDANIIKEILGAPGEGPAVAVHQSETPSRYGVVTMEGGLATALIEKPADPRSAWVNTGVYRLDPAIHDRAVAAHGMHGVGIPDILQAAVNDGIRVQTIKSAALWSDAVYPWDLLRVHADVLRRGEEVAVPPGVHAEQPVLIGEDATIGHGTVLGAGTCIGANVEIGPQCVLENCIVYDDVQIGAGSILRNTIVGEGARIGPRFTALSGPCDVRTADGWHALEDFGAVIGEDARVDGCVTLMPGAVLGDHVRVRAGRTVSSTVEDDALVL